MSFEFSNLKTIPAAEIEYDWIWRVNSIWFSWIKDNFATDTFISKCRKLTHSSSCYEFQYGNEIQCIGSLFRMTLQFCWKLRETDGGERESNLKRCYYFQTRICRFQVSIWFGNANETISKIQFTLLWNSVHSKNNRMCIIFSILLTTNALNRIDEPTWSTVKTAAAASI